MSEKTIRELALEAAQGSAPAFQELYRLTSKGAWFVALSIAKNEHDAQDILQESYLKAYRSMDQLAQPESFGAWLNQIVANKAKNYISRKKPGSFADYGDENARDWQEETDPAFIPDEHLDQAEAKALIDALVNELPEDQRLVVLLRYYDDMEVAAIAKSLEIPEGTVKSRLGRARQKLAAMLQQAQGKGLKLYAMAPIPLLAYFIKLLGFDAPGSDRLPPLLIGTAAAGTAAAGGAAAAGAARTAALTGKAGAISGKIAAIAAAAVVTVGGISAAGVYAYNRAAGAPVTAAQTTGAQVYSETHAASNQVPTLAIPGPGEVGENGEAASPVKQFPPTTQKQASGADKAPEAAVAEASETEPQATATAPRTTAARSTWPPFTAPPRTTQPRTAQPQTTLPPALSWVEPTTITQAPTMTEAPTTTEPPTDPKVDFSYRIAGNYIFITGYNGTRTDVVVPAYIDGVMVYHINDSAFEGTNIVRLELAPGIVCIHARAFANCPDLERVIIPPSVTAMSYPEVFKDSPNVKVVCAENSRAHTYAMANGVQFILQ